MGPGGADRIGGDPVTVPLPPMRHLPGPPTGPTTWPITVQVKLCCELLINDECDCAAFSAEALAAFSDPILLRPHSDVPSLTDPALDVDRPGGELVEAMCPPGRWGVTDNTVEVGP